MINVLIKTDTRYPANRKIIRRAVSDTFKKYKVDADFEISVAVVGSRKMKQLSVDFLNDSQKHQILTFALNEEGNIKVIKPESGQSTVRIQGFINPPDGFLRLGDIVLCWPEVLMSASNDDLMVDEEVYDLVCHGVEHLLGYEHNSGPS